MTPMNDSTVIHPLPQDHLQVRNNFIESISVTQYVVLSITGMERLGSIALIDTGGSHFIQSISLTQYMGLFQLASYTSRNVNSRCVTLLDFI